MKSIKLSLATILATASLAITANASEVGVSANVSMTSDYMWRGMTQSAGSPAIQGGFDLDYEGFYIGTWGSNVAGDPDETQGGEYYYGKASMELDLYGGYSTEISGVGIDVGFLQFMYPKDSEAKGWGEAYLGLSYDLEMLSVGAKYSYAIDTMDNGWTDYNLLELSASVPLPQDMAIDVTYGLYENVGDFYYAGFTKSYKSYEFTVAYTGISYDSSYADGSESKATLTVGTSF